MKISKSPGSLQEVSRKSPGSPFSVVTGLVVVCLVSVRCINAQRWTALENRKTNMLFKQLTCVGIRQEREAGESVQYPFLVILLGCVILRLRVLPYKFKSGPETVLSRSLNFT